MEILHEIETAGKIPFTGLINNSNLGNYTEPDDVLASMDYANRMAELSGLPLVATTVLEKLSGELEGRIENLYPLTVRRKIFEYFKEEGI